MSIMKAVMVVVLCMTASACSSKFRSYDGPEVTRILVYKDSRRMYLMHGDAPLRAFDIDLGFAPEGDKAIEGDGKTPEGDYVIDRKNPDSAFHLSLGISYPAPHDVIAAKELGKGPGGDIFIHGGPRPGIDRQGPDWTAGCIAVTDEEVEEIYAMIRTGTPISIYP
jgi:murein L,D-transpeptidase YafK